MHCACQAGTTAIVCAFGICMKCDALKCELYLGSCLQVQSLLLVLSKMFSKHGRPDHYSRLPAEKRFRANVQDCFLSGALPANRAQSLINDANAAHTVHVSDLVDRTERCSNASRNLRRRSLKDKGWPKMYKFNCPVYSLEDQQDVSVGLHMLLPHEVLNKFARYADLEVLTSTAGMSKASKDHMAKCANAMGCQVKDICGIGLWNDGAPCNWDRTRSVEVLTMSFPGLTDRWKNIRVPIFGIMKDYLAKDKTYDCLFEVLSWSFTALMLGKHPAARHDNQPWQPQDSQRKSVAGKPLALKGVCCEVRGDWKMVAEVLRLPSWSHNHGICMRCDALKSERDYTLDAAWRSNRCSHYQLLARMAQQGYMPSKLWGIPFLTSEQVLIDWLHCADLGIAANFLASVFILIINKFQGNLDVRIKKLYEDMKAYYDVNPGPKLDRLTKTMLIKASGKKPKLRGSAAEVRHLIPFAAEKCMEYLNDGDAEEACAKRAMLELHKCYSYLKDYDAAAMEESGRKFAVFFCALEVHNPQRWQVIPKLHAFVELTSSGSNPAASWTYRDEDFGGAAAAAARKKGGKRSIAGTGEHILMRYMGNHHIPRIC